DRDSDVEECRAHGSAGALIDANVSGEGSGKLLALRKVLNRVRGGGLGISQNAAARVNDGDASAGGLSLLSGYIGQGMATVGFDAVSGELSFLQEVALDFTAQ